MAQKRTKQNGTMQVTHRNIKAICDLERGALERRTRSERISDALASQAGRMWFLVGHVVVFGVWFLWNSGNVPGLPVFDRAPYQLLMTLVSLESIFLTLIILMSQNRAAKRADERSHLDLQINLLAELETTTVLRLLKALCGHHGVPTDQYPELGELLDRIRPEDLAEQLEKGLPSDESPAANGD